MKIQIFLLLCFSINSFSSTLQQMPAREMSGIMQESIESISSTPTSCTFNWSKDDSEFLELSYSFAPHDKSSNLQLFFSQSLNDYSDFFKLLQSKISIASFVYDYLVEDQAIMTLETIKSDNSELLVELHSLFDKKYAMLILKKISTQMGNNVTDKLSIKFSRSNNQVSQIRLEKWASSKILDLHCLF